MLEATDRARGSLGGLRIRWVELERRGEPTGELPAPERALPAREPDEITQDAVAQAYRRLFWDMDIDPTKERPAGEALARRVAQGDDLPRILPLVDAYNLASAETLVPLSAFDLDALEPPLQLDLAEEGDVFEPIGADGKRELDPERPVWRDDSGIVGLPLYRDGLRTKLHEGSQSALVVTAGPQVMAPRVLPEAFRTLEAYLPIVGWRFTSSPGTLEL